MISLPGPLVTNLLRFLFLGLSALDVIRGSLSLTNLSSSMAGVYVCKAHNEVGTAQCNVTLEVSTGPGAAVVAGAVVGTLVGLGLLAGLVLLYHRRGKALEEPANDIKVRSPLGLSFSAPKMEWLWKWRDAHFYRDSYLSKW
ncbi:endothelial cell adhesion molecule [Homo sapiens]|uniref:Isoform 2 of Endothelial cell-selective adhesion molecule n=1 Tax=Homo sapiens TaxID=9606 RepID=Q96AP7-2|nr:endothelial cell adhesion molecule [Homo sapiens]BAG62750.1 unnamed protein product [Homo sapiens]